MEVIDALRRVKELLTGGWCQYEAHQFLRDAPDAYCLSGAVEAATGYRNQEYRVLVRELALTLVGQAPTATPIATGVIVNFNDNEFRTKEQVIDLVDQTILRLEGEERNEEREVSESHSDSEQTPVLAGMASS